MANQKLVDLLKQGVEQWNQWRQEYPRIPLDLIGANLYKANLSKADLGGANLYKANLSKADLSKADLNNANLGGATLSRANLSGAELIKADLGFAALSGANLSGANLSAAFLRWADLNGADLSRANLSTVNLDSAKLIRARLDGAYLGGATLSRADLSRTNLCWATLVDTNFTEATLTGCAIYGSSVWNVQLEGAKQNNLIIKHPDKLDEPTITVDDMEVAQFIYLLLNHKKLRNVLNAVTQRGVLLLGRFGGGGLEVLQAVAAKLREEKYLPIIFDFDRPQDRNYTETVKTLAGLSRFIIADLSGPSVPQELYATVPHFKIPFVPILESGRKQFAMATDLLEYPWVVRPPVIFASTDELVSLVPSKIIAPAEEKHQARQQLLDELFPS